MRTCSATRTGSNITRPSTSRALADWDPKAEPDTEIQFTPARVILQDLTGVPAVVDLAAMREAMRALGGDPTKINPLIPAELVIDHSVVADVFGVPEAFTRNVELEFQRNEERFQFLRWGQDAFDGFRVVPPGTGIVHQVNIEHLARVVMTSDGQAYPDTCVGTDSHTTMENGLGVLGWGVGGIEAEAAMLGQPISMLIPKVVGFRLTGQLPQATTATDLVLTITEILRKHGVVGKFVEFHGDGVGQVPVANRATIGNMSPEFGSTCAIFPIDDATIEYLRLTGRPETQLDLVEKYARAQGLWHDPDRELRFSEELTLDLSTVVPSIAGPKRPQDKIELANAKTAFRDALPAYTGAANGSFPASDPGETEDIRATHPVKVTLEDGAETTIDHGHVVIAAITSCTNTSNPYVMIGAALLAKQGRREGPGPQALGEDHPRPRLEGRHGLLRAGRPDPVPGQARLQPRRLRLHHLHRQLRPAAAGDQRRRQRRGPHRRLGPVGQQELRGPHQPRRQDELPGVPAPRRRLRPGRHDGHRPGPRAARHGQRGQAGLPRRHLAVTRRGHQRRHERRRAPRCSPPTTPTSSRATTTGAACSVPTGDTFEWAADSTYVRRPPYFDGMPADPVPVTDIHGAKVLAKLGDSVTTDHISPAGAIKATAPAGLYLTEHGIERKDFNSYGSRRGNHEVMIRGTFANIRLRNQLAPGTEGGVTIKDGKEMSIYDASREYIAEGTPLIVLGGKEYGSGSSRDWAAKGTALLGVRAVLVESFERIHRSNLIGMGVLPLQFKPGESAESLGLTGQETFNIEGITAINEGGIPNEVVVTADDKRFTATVRIDTPGEADYYRHGGIMQYVLRSLR